MQEIEIPSQEIHMTGKILEELNAVFQKFVGYQLRVFYPKDKGLYYQGPFEHVMVTEGHDNTLTIRLWFTWVAVSFGKNERWVTDPRTIKSLKHLEISTEEFEKLVQEGSLLTADRYLHLQFLPPGDKLWIKKPKE